MFRQYRKIEKGEFFLVAGDCAAGGGDFSVCQFLSKTKLDVPLVYQSRTTAVEMTNQIYPVLEKIHDATGVKPVVAYERANGGVFEMERLAVMNRLGKYEIFKMPSFGRVDAPEPVKYGWDTTSATRPAMLSSLKEAIDNRIIAIYDRETINELFSFVIVRTSTSWKAQAEKHAHDDLVMALAIAYQMFQICQPPTTSKQAEMLIEKLPEEKLFDREGFY